MVTVLFTAPASQVKCQPTVSSYFTLQIGGPGFRQGSSKDIKIVWLSKGVMQSNVRVECQHIRMKVCEASSKGFQHDAGKKMISSNIKSCCGHCELIWSLGF